MFDPPTISIGLVFLYIVFIASHRDERELTLVVIAMAAYELMGNHFSLTRNLSSIQIIAFAVLTGFVAVARSPSSAIAIISESRASGPFTETVQIR